MLRSIFFNSKCKKPLKTVFTNFYKLPMNKGKDIYKYTFQNFKKYGVLTMEDDNSFWLLAKNLKKRSFEARSLHILSISWDKFLILCSTPYLANAFVKLEVEHRIRISKLKDQNHLQMYRGHAGIFPLGNQDPCNSVIMDISKIFLSQKGSISSSKFELFLPV